MSKNYSNLQNLTNYIQVSPEFPELPFYLQRVNIPGLSLDPESTGVRGRNKGYFAQDTIDFNPLSFEMLIDEDLEIWLIFQNYIRENLRKDGTFGIEPFQFSLQINNNKGNKLFIIEFHDCRINSVSDLQLDSTSDVTQHTLSVDIVYDQYEIVHSMQGNNNPAYLGLEPTKVVGCDECGPIDPDETVISPF